MRGGLSKELVRVQAQIAENAASRAALREPTDTIEFDLKGICEVLSQPIGACLHPNPAPPHRYDERDKFAQTNARETVIGICAIVMVITGRMSKNTARSRGVGGQAMDDKWYTLMTKEGDSNGGFAQKPTR